MDRLDKAVIYNYNVIMNGLAFEWDELKSSSNKQKHGLSFEEAKTASSGSSPRELPRAKSRNNIGKGGENEERI